jgi:hypothetical protein
MTSRVVEAIEEPSISFGFATSCDIFMECWVDFKPFRRTVKVSF